MFTDSSLDAPSEMKRIFTAPQWLIAAMAICLLARSADAQNRTAKVTVNVMSAKQEPVAGAGVTLTPSTGRPAIHVETGADGSVTADVSLGASKFGEGWLFSEPTIKIAAEKDSQKGSSLITIR